MPPEDHQYTRRTYSDGAQFVHFLLGPATVALPLRLWRSWDKFKGGTLSPFCGLAAGSLTAIVSAVDAAKRFGASHQMIASLAPKSVTTLIAMVVAEKMGGIPSLTAVLVISTGVFGAVTARWSLEHRPLDEVARRAGGGESMAHEKTR